MLSFFETVVAMLVTVGYIMTYYSLLVFHHHLFKVESSAPKIFYRRKASSLGIVSPTLFSPTKFLRSFTAKPSSSSSSSSSSSLDAGFKTSPLLSQIGSGLLLGSNRRPRSPPANLSLDDDGMYAAGAASNSIVDMESGGGGGGGDQSHLSGKLSSSSVPPTSSIYSTSSLSSSSASSSSSPLSSSSSSSSSDPSFVFGSFSAHAYALSCSSTLLLLTLLVSEVLFSPFPDDCDETVVACRLPLLLRSMYPPLLSFATFAVVYSLFVDPPASLLLGDKFTTEHPGGAALFRLAAVLLLACTVSVLLKWDGVLNVFSGVTAVGQCISVALGGFGSVNYPYSVFYPQIILMGLTASSFKSPLSNDVFLQKRLLPKLQVLLRSKVTHLSEVVSTLTLPSTRSDSHKSSVLSSVAASLLAEIASLEHLIAAAEESRTPWGRAQKYWANALALLLAVRVLLGLRQYSRISPPTPLDVLSRPSLTTGTDPVSMLSRWAGVLLFGLSSDETNATLHRSESVLAMSFAIWVAASSVKGGAEALVRLVRMSGRASPFAGGGGGGGPSGTAGGLSSSPSSSNSLSRAVLSAAMSFATGCYVLASVAAVRSSLPESHRQVFDQALCGTPLADSAETQPPPSPSSSQQHLFHYREGSHLPCLPRSAGLPQRFLVGLFLIATVGSALLIICIACVARGQGAEDLKAVREEIEQEEALGAGDDGDGGDDDDSRGRGMDKRNDWMRRRKGDGTRNVGNASTAWHL